MIVPCHRGGHHCRWPACPLDCDGRLIAPDSDPERTSKETRAALVQEGRSAYRAGLEHDHVTSCFKDPDMTIDWRLGWRWELESHDARAYQQGKECDCAGCRRQRTIKRIKNG